MPTKDYPVFKLSGGVVDIYSEVEAPINFATSIVNFRYGGSDNWYNTDIGYRDVNSTLTLKNWVCGFHFKTKAVNKVIGIDTSGVMYEVNFTLGTLSQVLGATFTVSLNNIPMFCTFEDKLIVVDGNQDPQEWDGVNNLHAVANWSGGCSFAGSVYQNPSIVKEWENRAIFAGFSNSPSAFLMSDFGSYNSYTYNVTPIRTDAFASNLDMGGGGKITCVTPFKLKDPIESSLFIFKEQSTYRLKGKSSDSADTDRFMTEFYTNIGCIGKYAALSIADDIMFIDGSAMVRTIMTSKEEGKPLDKAFNEDYRSLLADINYSTPDLVQIIDVPQTNDILITFAETQCIYVNKIAVLNYKNGKFRWSILGSWPSVHNFQSFFWWESTLCGVYTNHLVKFFNGETFNGEPIPYSYSHFPIVFGNPDIVKQIGTVVLRTLIKSNTTTTCKNWWDGVLSRGFMDSIPLKVKEGSGVWDSSLWDVGIWANSMLCQSRVYCRGSGNFFYFKISGNVPTGGVTYLGFSAKVNEGTLQTVFYN